MSLWDTLLGRSETPAEAARRNGDLVYDDEHDRFVEVDE